MLTPRWLVVGLVAMNWLGIVWLSRVLKGNASTLSDNGYIKDPESRVNMRDFDFR